MLADDRYAFIVSHVEGMALNALWLYVKDESDTFPGRKKILLWALERLLDDGLIAFGKYGNTLELSSEEIVTQFERALPKDEADLDDGIWFFTDACPAGIGWRTADGRIDWV